MSDKIRVTATLGWNSLGLGTDNGSHVWIIGGSRISKFNRATDLSSGGPLWWVDPKTPSTTFTWVSGGSPANYSVHANARVKGQFVKTIRNFQVTRPTVNSASLYPCPADPRVDGFRLGLLGGCAVNPPLPGYPAGWETPGFFSSQTSGQPVIWVQIVTSFATMAVYPTTSYNRSTAGLDGLVPYSSDPYTDDSPAQPLWYQGYPDINYVSRNDSFSTFLMLARSGVDYAVPIGLVNWNWNGNCWKNSGVWGQASGSRQITLSAASSTFPVWTSRANPSALLP